MIDNKKWSFCIFAQVHSFVAIINTFRTYTDYSLLNKQPFQDSVDFETWGVSIKCKMVFFLNNEVVHREVEGFKARTACSLAIRAGVISGIWSDFVFLFAIVNTIIWPILFVSGTVSLSLVRQDVLRRKTAGSRSDPQSMIKINHFLCIICACV